MKPKESLDTEQYDPGIYSEYMALSRRSPFKSMIQCLRLSHRAATSVKLNGSDEDYGGHILVLEIQACLCQCSSDLWFDVSQFVQIWVS